MPRAQVEELKAGWQKSVERAKRWAG